MRRQIILIALLVSLFACVRGDYSRMHGDQFAPPTPENFRVVEILQRYDTGGGPHYGWHFKWTGYKGIDFYRIDALQVVDDEELHGYLYHGRRMQTWFTSKHHVLGWKAHDGSDETNMGVYGVECDTAYDIFISGGGDGVRYRKEWSESVTIWQQRTGECVPNLDPPHPILPAPPTP